MDLEQDMTEVTVKQRQTPRPENLNAGYVDKIKPELFEVRHSSKRHLYPITRACSIAIGDLIAILLAYLVAYEAADALRMLLTDTSIAAGAPIPSLNKILLLVFIPSVLLIVLFSMWGHYNRRHPYWTEVRDITKAIMYTTAATTLILFSLKMDFSRLWAISFFLVLTLLIPIARLLARKVLSTVNVWTKPTIIIGDGPTAFTRAKQFCRDKYLGLKVTDYIDISSHTRISNLASLYRYGHNYSTESFGTQRERPHLVVSIENLESLEENKKSFDIIMGACSTMTFIPPITGIPLYNSQLIQPFRADTAVFRLHNNLKRTGSKITKRAIDLCLCSLGILVLSPVMLIVALLVKLDGGPIVFGQRRIGQGGKEFTCWKFRSMQTDADERLKKLLETDKAAKDSWEKDHKLKNDPRITVLGNFIRKTSLDELPQFLNVLKGEMSLIGPRPIVSSEIKKYGSSFEYYSESRPGITGLWQISGRNDTNYDERVALDVWYVRNWSPWLDLVIGFKTIPILVFGKGAY